MQVRLYISLEVDEDEYPTPADGQVGSEIEQSLHEYLYDIDGIDIKSIKTISE